MILLATCTSVPLNENHRIELQELADKWDEFLIPYVNYRAEYYVNEQLFVITGDFPGVVSKDDQQAIMQATNRILTQMPAAQEFMWRWKVEKDRGTVTVNNYA